MTILLISRIHIPTRLSYYYLAAILPITKTFVQKFESIMGRFIWNSSGWLLRVSMEEIKNGRLYGGLGLVCLESMCQSLMLSQFLRLLRSSDVKTVASTIIIGLMPCTDVGLFSSVVTEETVSSVTPKSLSC